MSKKVTTERMKLAALALVAFAALALLSGCGGGSSESESALRKKLEAAGAKLTAAKSFEASVLFEVEEDDELEPLACIDLSLEGGKPEKLDLLVFDDSCEGGSDAHELILVGNRAWASSEAAEYSEAKISPQVAEEVSGEQTEDLQGLFEAAEGIDSVSKGSAVMERDGKYVDVPTYFFDAPASAFPDSEELGDTKVEFEAAIDRKGFLRELTVRAAEDGTGAKVTTTYEKVDQSQDIHPPDKSEIHGLVVDIRSKADLDELLGAPSG